MAAAASLNPAVNPYAALSGKAADTQTANEAGSSDRFLKLLVTQMQNQDPLNPMDNAQITSQMAQINTVNGIEKLNTTVQSLSTQFTGLQTMTGAALVGRNVSWQGNKLHIDAGKAAAGFDLSGKADRVKLEVLNAAGHVVDTQDLGAFEAGRHDFTWTAPAAAAANVSASGHTFRLTATVRGGAVSTTPLMQDRVDSVNTDGTSLVLETRNSGPIAYRDVKAFN